MQALILAAGRGSRLGNMTKNHPKGLTLLANHPLIEWQISALEGAGISLISAATGYLAEQIKPYVKYTFHNDIWQESNMVRSLFMAADYLMGKNSIISYSDIIYSRNIVKQLAATEGDIVIAYDPNWLKQWQLRFESPLDDAESFILNDENQLIEIGLKTDHVENIMGQYLGLLKFSPRGWRVIHSYLKQLPSDQVNALDMTALLNQLLKINVQISVCAISDSWFEIDNTNDLALCEKELKHFNWQNNFN